MTLAVQNRTARPRKAQALAVIAGTAHAGLSGKALAKHIARKQTRGVNPFTGWDAYREKAQAIALGAKFGPWAALEMATAYAALRTADLEARIAALEARDAPATARAPEPKPQRALALRLMKDISAKSVAPLIAALEANPGRPVKLTIASHGGIVSEAQKLARAIEKHGNVSAHAIISCDSAATVVWAAARARSCLKNCSFLVHAPSNGDGSTPTAADQRRLDAVARDISAYLAKRSNGKAKATTFQRLMTQEGVRLTGAQMCTMGLLNTTIKRPYEPKGRKP